MHRRKKNINILIVGVLMPRDYGWPFRLLDSVGFIVLCWARGSSVPLLQMSKYRLQRIFKHIAQGHTASKWWSQDLILGHLLNPSDF